MSLPSTASAVPAAWRPVLKGLQVPQRDRARFEEIGDQQPRGPTEQLQEVPNQPASVLALVDRRLEQLGIANLLYLAQGAFQLQPIDERLNGGVGDALVIGQTIEDFADRARPQLPALFQDSCFGS